MFLDVPFDFAYKNLAEQVGNRKSFILANFGPDPPSGNKKVYASCFSLCPTFAS